MKRVKFVIEMALDGVVPQEWNNEDRAGLRRESLAGVIVSDYIHMLGFDPTRVKVTGRMVEEPSFYDDGR